MGCEMQIVWRSEPSRKSHTRMYPSSEPVSSWNGLCGLTTAVVTASEGCELPGTPAAPLGGGVSVETTSPVATEWIFTEGPVAEKKYLQGLSHSVPVPLVGENMRRTFRPS